MSGVIISIFLITFLSAGGCTAGITGTFPSGEPTFTEQGKITLDREQEDTPAWGKEMARGGCCSWHGGVCGCPSGRVVCCDGTFSPSCHCNRNSNEKVPDSE